MATSSPLLWPWKKRLCPFEYFHHHDISFVCLCVVHGGLANDIKHFVTMSNILKLSAWVINQAIVIILPFLRRSVVYVCVLTSICVFLCRTTSSAKLQMVAIEWKFNRKITFFLVFNTLCLIIELIIWIFTIDTYVKKKRNSQF